MLEEFLRGLLVRNETLYEARFVKLIPQNIFRPKITKINHPSKLYPTLIIFLATCLKSTTIGSNMNNEFKNI